MSVSCRLLFVVCLLSPLQQIMTMEPGWGSEPVEILSHTRARICLNGLWNFCPDAAQPLPAPDDAAWGLKHVPGAWANAHWNMQLRKSIHSFGKGPRWEKNRRGLEFRELESAWYRRTLHIPEDWQGSRVLLDLTRVSTDAVVYVDGKQAGEVRWPHGEVDLTDLVTPGQTSELSLQVIATVSEEPVLNFMATADSQVTAEKATLNFRGIIGEVFLRKQPKGIHIEDVFIQPSVRNKELTLSVLVQDLPSPQELTLGIRVLDANGTEVITAGDAHSFSPNTPLTVTLPWADPRLWDFGEPNLYTLEVTLEDETKLDVRTERFGFKEFWIEGRQFYLNGRPVNLRPIVTKDGNATGNVEIIRRHIRRYMEMGYNVGELWPSDHLQRGSGHYRKLWKEIADEEGFGLIATLPRSNSYIMDSRWRNVWEENKDRYAQDILPELIDFRNHPSVLYWVNSANFFGHHQDQNPRHLGRPMEVNPGWHQREAAGLEAIGMIKEQDPTRPVATHQGAQVGDVFMTNFYLNMLPLQDRMEWLSDYVENGTMPFMPVEMGTPLDCTLRRGRNGFSDNTRSEPLMTEFLAIYFGADVYRTEPAAYRKDLVETFKGDQLYGWWQKRDSKISSPGFQALQTLFTRNTYRAWRTWGNSAGMIAWADAHGWIQGPGASTRIPSSEPFVPGHRGTWLPSIERWKTAPLMEEGGWIQLPAGDMLIANNQRTLAWIAGAPAAFTERSHLFASSGTLLKQAALLNDHRLPADYDLHWSVTLGGNSLESGTASGEIPAGDKVMLPIEVVLPDVLQKTEGTIQIRARIGDQQHEDTFRFRVFPPPAPLTIEAMLEDPKGLTTAMLENLEVQIEAADEDTPGLMIVGREALGESTGLSEEAQNVLKQGGTVLVMIQDRTWYSRVPGFRIADHISRQVFPVQDDHPVLKDLDEVDLRNWNGEASLIEAYPVLTEQDTKLGAYGVPYYGWRWGTRGAVSSAMMEKPHTSGWTPILEGEFDLAYSPLMELNLKQGRVILCSLDLEDLAPTDPAAAQLTRQILSYAATPRHAPRRTTFFWGTESEAEAMTGHGLLFTSVSALPEEPGLLVVGSVEGLRLEELEEYAAKGGRVLLLPQDANTSPVPVHLDARAGFVSDVPDWLELRGISLAELRTRASTPLHVLTNDPRLETAARGFLGRMISGKGLLIASQLDPSALDADTKTYLRFTRWRFTRAQSQLLANLGGEFEQDARILSTPEDSLPPVSLAGDWEVRMVKRFEDPNQEKHDDPGVSEEATAILAKGEPMIGDLTKTKVPAMMDSFTKENGEAVMQQSFTLTEAQASQDLILSLGTVDDNETTYVNGKKVGATDGWNVPRTYTVPASLLKEGENLIQVRIWDSFGGGGTAGTPSQFSIGVPEKPTGKGLYHPDYRDDFKMGDDPYRYYRW